MGNTPPTDHPLIDWSKWEPTGEGDVRSPCPMLNSLANHRILPHDGKNITVAIAVKALSTSLNMDPSIAATLATHALGTNPDNKEVFSLDNLCTNVKNIFTGAPDHSAQFFNLNHLAKHGDIEHDASLSRNDRAFGDNHTFNPKIWDTYIESYGGAKETTFASVSNAKFARVMAAKKEHKDAKKDFRYGVKEFIISYVESAFFLGLLGGPKDGKIPIEYLKVLFEEERLPFNEGWRPSDKVIGVSDFKHLILSLIAANERKVAEAKDVGLGTVIGAVEDVASILHLHCRFM